MPMPKSTVVDAYPHDYRYASNFPRATGSVTLAAGQKLEEGSVLGRITATGEYVLSCKTKVNGDAVADGSEKPSLVLMNDCDATAGAKTPAVYKTGDFLTTFLKLGRGHTFPSVADDLRDVSIFFSRPAT